MTNTEEMLFNLSSKELADLKRFKKEHAKCSQTHVGAFDMIPADCFGYHFYPSTLGGLVEVDCVCGASWSSMDGSFYTREIPEPREVKDEDLMVEIVNHLLIVTKRPGMFFSEESLAQFLAYKNGICQGLRFFGRDQEYCDLANRVHQRIENDLLGSNNRNLLLQRLLEKIGDEKDALKYWRDTLIACLVEEYPQIANTCLKQIDTDI